MAPAFDSIVGITDQKDQWCFIARVIGLWRSVDSEEPANTLSIDMVLMDSYGHKICANVGKELIDKFKNLLKEDKVYLMYNFRVMVNNLEVKPAGHNYFLHFMDETKIKPVDDGLAPIYSYFFTHPDEFLSHRYRSEVLVDVIGMLSKVQVEDDCLIDGKMQNVVSMTLQNNERSFKCILHGGCMDKLSDFVLSGSSDNACVVMLFAKMNLWKGVPTVQNAEPYTKLLFNPEINAVATLRHRMNGSNFSPYKAIYATNGNTKLHVLDLWVYSTARSTVNDLSSRSVGSKYVTLGTVDLIDTDNGWWYVSCKCHKKVVPDNGMYFCRRCDRHVLTVIPRYNIKLRVVDNTGTSMFVMPDRVSAELFGISCANILEQAGQVDMATYIPTQLTNMVGKSYLLMIGASIQPMTVGEEFYPVAKITDDDALIDAFKIHHSI